MGIATSEVVGGRRRVRFESAVGVRLDHVLLEPKGMEIVDTRPKRPRPFPEFLPSVEALQRPVDREALRLAKIKQDNRKLMKGEMLPWRWLLL